MKHLYLIPVVALIAGCSNNTAVTDGERTKPSIAASVRSYPYCDEHGLKLGQPKEVVIETLRRIIANGDGRHARLVARDAQFKELAGPDVLLSDKWQFIVSRPDLIGGIAVALEFETNTLVRITEVHLR